MGKQGVSPLESIRDNHQYGYTAARIAKSNTNRHHDVADDWRTAAPRSTNIRTGKVKRRLAGTTVTPTLLKQGVSPLESIRDNHQYGYTAARIAKSNTNRHHDV